MIKKDIRVNNEFYVCPVYNQAIKDGKVVRTFKADKMCGLGTYARVCVADCTHNSLNLLAFLYIVFILLQISRLIVGSFLASLGSRI